MRFIALGLLLVGLVFWAVNRGYLSSDLFAGLWQNKPVENAPPTTFYKWQDEYGNWQFGDRPPAGVAYQESSVESVQTMPAVKPPVPATPTTSSSGEKGISYNPLMPLTNPGKIKQTIEDAQAVEQKLQQRQQQMEQVM